MAISFADKCEHTFKALVDLFETVDKAFAQEPESLRPSALTISVALAIKLTTRRRGWDGTIGSILAPIWSTSSFA